jgi:protein with PEP-CTERM/exosortase system signal
MFYAAKSGMKAFTKILLAVTAVAAFSVVQPVEADRYAQAGASSVNGAVPVPDAGSTLPLLGSALLAVAGLRRKLRG